MLEELFNLIFDCNGWLSGSYVRERIIRQDQDSEVGDIDITIPFEYFDELYELLHLNYEVREESLDYDEEGRTALMTFRISTYYFDINSCEDYSYLTYPDVDVNTLCWDGENVTSWLDYNEFDYYKTNTYSFDIKDIVERCKRKECIALVDEWPNNNRKNNIKYLNDIMERVNKLKNRGWKILNNKSFKDLKID